MWVSSSGTVREEEDVVDNFKEVGYDNRICIFDPRQVTPRIATHAIYPELNWFDCHPYLPNILVYKLIPKEAKELQRQVMELLEKGYI